MICKKRFIVLYSVIVICLICLIVSGCKKISSVLNDDNSNNWVRIAPNIFFDKSTIKIKDNNISGLFKENNLSDDKKNNVIYSYKTILISAYCDADDEDILKIEYPVYNYYDENDKILFGDTINTVWVNKDSDENIEFTHASNIKNGEILYATLCSYYNP